jgi:hypothetical protein
VIKAIYRAKNGDMALAQWATVPLTPRLDVRKAIHLHRNLLHKTSDTPEDCAILKSHQPTGPVAHSSVHTVLSVSRKRPTTIKR